MRRSDSCRSNGADETQPSFSFNVKWDVFLFCFLADFWNPDIKENKCLQHFIILSDENKIKIKVKNHQISCFSRFFFFHQLSLIWCLQHAFISVTGNVPVKPSADTSAAILCCDETDEERKSTKQWDAAKTAAVRTNRNSQEAAKHPSKAGTRWRFNQINPHLFTQAFTTSWRWPKGSATVSRR